MAERMTKPIGPVSLDVLLERLDYLRNEIAEMKDQLRVHLKSEQDWERDSIEVHSTLRNAIDAAHRRLDDQAKRLGEQEEQIKGVTAEIRLLQSMIGPLVTTNKILSVIGGLLGTSIFALIWAILLHRISISIP
jgi:hypothetical protein